MKKFDILLITIFSFAVILGLAGELQAQPDLFIREFTLSPSEPTKGQPVDVRVNVYNRGDRPAGPFTVEWWPGENYTAPACTWRVESLAARGGRILTCRYEGYPSWYGRLTTKVVADPSGEVAESNEGNNESTITIRVQREGVLMGRPDLYISEFSLSPAEPTKGEPVNVRVGVYNRGNAPAGAFTVEWWPGEDYTAPACTWRVESLAAKGGRILTCRYEGYPSWYSRLTTKVVADPRGEVAESNEGDNDKTMVIRVQR